MSVEGRFPASRRPVASGFGRRIGDVIALRDAGRGDGSAAGSIALRRLLRRSAALGDAGGLVRRLLDLHLGGGPALHQLDARISVAVDLVRSALTRATGADRAAFPARLREGVVTLLEPTRVIANALLDVADGDAIHYRLHARDAAREHHRVLRFLLAVHPAGQLDRLLADPADVDRPLGQDRIVAERLEHPLFQSFVRHAFILQLVVVVVVVLAEVVVRHDRPAAAVSSSSWSVLPRRRAFSTSPLNPPTRCASSMPTANPA